MNKIMLSMMILVSSFVLGQNYKFVDSTYIKYHISTNNIIMRNTYHAPSEISDMLDGGDYIRISTAEKLSYSISDTMNKMFNTTSKINFKGQLNTITNILDAFAVDSSADILYVRISYDCQVCKTSIINSIMSQKESFGLTSGRKIKSIYVNYLQSIKDSRNEYIVVTIKRWFRRKEMFIMYNERN